MNTELAVLSIIKKFSKGNSEELSINTSIRHLNFDSLDFLEFQMAIDDEFKIEVEIDDFLKCNHVSDIINLVNIYCNKK